MVFLSFLLKLQFIAYGFNKVFLLLVENLMTGTSNVQPSDVPGQQLDVGTLPNEALEAIYKQVVVELDTLSKTLPLIQGAINERIAAIEAIKKFQSIKPDDEVLVPLTLSSYVKGNVPDTSKVMVILGEDTRRRCRYQMP